MLEDNVYEERVTLQLVVDQQAEPEPDKSETCDFCSCEARFLFSVGYEHWQVCASCRDKYPELDNWVWD